MGKVKDYGLWLEGVRHGFLHKTEHYPEDVLNLNNIFKDLMPKYLGEVSVRECVKDLISDYEFQKHTSLCAINGQPD